MYGFEFFTKALNFHSGLVPLNAVHKKGNTGMCEGKNKLCLYVGPVLCASRQNLLRILKGYIFFYFVILEPFSSRNIIRAINSKRVGWMRNVARMGEKRNVYVAVMGKAEGKRPLGRCRHTRKDN